MKGLSIEVRAENSVGDSASSRSPNFNHWGVLKRSINIGRIPMLCANEQRCKRRLKTAHWAGTFGAIIF